MAAALLDVDGTLVDTNYQHALAWFRAFREHGFVLPVWRIHRAVGMGGDQLVPHLIGEAAAREHGDEIRATEAGLYPPMLGEVEPLEGARDLLVELKARGLTVVLASSAKADEVEHYLDLLDARELADGWTTSADVERTKPAPDLVLAAQEKAGARRAVMVGDTPWDVEAAAKVSVPTLAVLTGGFHEVELREAGASAVFASIPDLIAHLDETDLGRE
jgi:HAD superfamily hydrolase (TIGR01509 family)